MNDELSDVMGGIITIAIIVAILGSTDAPKVIDRMADVFSNSIKATLGK